MRAHTHMHTHACTHRCACTHVTTRVLAHICAYHHLWFGLACKPPVCDFYTTENAKRIFFGQLGCGLGREHPLLGAEKGHSTASRTPSVTSLPGSGSAANQHGFIGSHSLPCCKQICQDPPTQCVSVCVRYPCTHTHTYTFPKLTAEVCREYYL